MKILLVSIKTSGLYRLAFFSTEALQHRKNKWLMCLMQSLGKYNLSCYATESQLQEYNSGKFREFMECSNISDDNWPIKIAVKAVGLQIIDEDNPTVEEINLDPSSEVWVFNHSTHIAVDGRLIHPRKSPFVWMGSWIKNKKGSENIASPSLASAVVPHSLSPTALEVLIRALEQSYLQNFASSLLVIGVHVLHLHYEMLLHEMSGVPVGVLYGDVQTGKTTAMQSALSLLGTQESHYRKRCSDGRFFQLTAQTTLGLVLDYLTNVGGILEKIIVLFDGQNIDVGGETIKPRTSFMTALNMKQFKQLAEHHR